MATESVLASLSMMKNPFKNLVILPTSQHKKVVIQYLKIGGLI